MTDLTKTETEKTTTDAVKQTITAAAHSIGKKRYWIAGFCFLAYVVAFMDRSNIGVLIADRGFTNALGIANDKSAQGSLMSVFLVSYGVTCFLAGPFVQRFGAKKTLIAGLFCWAVLMAIMGAVPSLRIMLICRGLLGVGESVLGPAVASLVQAWFPKNEKGDCKWRVVCRN